MTSRRQTIPLLVVAAAAGLFFLAALRPGSQKLSSARADVQRAQSTWSTLNALTLHLANLHTGRSSVLLVSEQADPVVSRRGFEALPTE